MASAAWVWASGGIESTPFELNRFIRAYVGGKLFGRTVQAQQLRFVPGHSEPIGPGQNSAGMGIFRYRTRCGTVGGSVEEATAAAAAGADAVIAQGVEAGGHVRGSTPMLELLERVRAAVKIPVLAAGGIIDAEGVRAALDGGAVAAVAGTRFLLSDESHAHPDYKQRCLDASETILTELFGLGWPGAPHRVIPNGATHRWLRGDPRGPQWIRAANRLTAPLASRIPTVVQDRAIRAQRPSQPFLGPQPPTDEGPVNLVDSGPLYAGVNVPRVADIRPAGELVKALTP